MSINKHVRLLPGPAPDPDQLARENQTSSTLSKTPRSQRRKACEMCRAKKTACNNGQPRCGICIRRRTRCVYRPSSGQQVQQELDLYADIMQCLLNGPEGEAIENLRRMRASAHPASTVASLYGSMHNKVRPSELSTAYAVSPFSTSNLEFELAVSHEAVYRAWAPLDIQDIDLGFMANTSISNSGGSSVNRASSDGHLTDSLPSVSAMNNPVCPSTYCDVRLAHLRMDYWTTLDIDDQVAARAISVYLEVNHPMFGFFDADLFLDDLVHQRTQFCSAFLVHALLAYACKTYGALDPNASEIGSIFYNTAVVLWRAQRGSDSILTLAAMNLLTLYNHVDGGTDIALELLQDSRDMADRLKLFGIKHSAALGVTYDGLSSEWKRATAHVAWGAYCWLTLNSFYCPAAPISFQPCYPIPNHRRSADGTDDPMLFQSLASPPQPYMGQTFAVLCRFWSIMQEVTWVYGGRYEYGDPVVTGSLAFAETIFQRLLALADGVSADIYVENGRPEHVIGFQILFHCGVIDLFRPFNEQQGGKSMLKGFAAKDSTVKDVVRASLEQLKQLLMACHHHHPRTFYSPTTNAAGIHLGNAMLHEASVPDGDKDWRFFFHLSLANCRELYRCFPVYSSVARGLLAMAIRDGLMTSREARALLDVVVARRLGDVTEPNSVAAGEFIIDLDLAATSRNAASARVLAESFEDLSTMEEFTTHFVPEPVVMSDLQPEHESGDMECLG